MERSSMLKEVSLVLGTVEEEAALCRAAFARSKVGDLVLHCHHRLLVEPLMEPAESRINYIINDKNYSEQAIRLRLFRPLPKEFVGSDLDKASADYVKASVDLDKALYDSVKALSDSNKVHADYYKACVDYNKVRFDCFEACDNFNKVVTDWGQEFHATTCQPGCPWDGETIFPGLATF